MIIGGSTTFDIGSFTPSYGASAVTAPAFQSAYPGSVMGGGLSIQQPLGFDTVVGASPFSGAVSTTYQSPFVSPAPFVFPSYGNSPNSVLYAHYAPTTATPATVPATTPLPAATTTTTAPVSTTPAATTTPATTPAATTAATTAGGDTARTAEQKRKAQQRRETAAKAEQADKAEPRKPAARKTVTVKAGDTLSKIAAAHGVSWQKLYELNKGVIGGNPNLIRPGQALKLP